MSNDDFKVSSRRPNAGKVDFQTQVDSEFGEANNGPVSLQRRKAMKIALSVATAGPAIGLAFEQHGIALPEKAQVSDFKNSVIDTIDAQQAGFELPNLTINININRPDLSDWLLFENLTESPLMIRQFSPRFVAYNSHVLDMEAMLARQQRGKNELEIWPNYAWTHSVKGAVSKRDIDQTIEYSNTVMIPNMPDNHSLQLACVVDESGVVKIAELLS